MANEKVLEDHELISQVRLRGFRPSQVYKTDELMKDEGFKEAIESEVDYRIYVRDQEAKEELNKEMQKEIEEDKLKSEENEFIPGPEGESIKKKKRSEMDDNEFIPDGESSDNSGDDDNEFIPD